MTKTISKRIIALLTAVLLLCSLISCTTSDIDSDYSIDLIKYVIYKNSEGDYFYINYNPSAYDHNIGNVHTFAGDIPKEFEGYTFSVSASLRESKDTTDEPEIEKFTRLQAESALSTYGNPIDIYTYSVASNILNNETLIKNRISNAMVGHTMNNSEWNNISIPGVDFSEWYDDFITSGSLNKSFTLFYLEKTSYSINFSLKLEKYTFVKTISQTYDFSGDTYIKTTPYYNETGKQVASQVEISSAFFNLSYIKY